MGAELEPLSQYVSDDFIEQVTPVINLLKRVLSQIIMSSDEQTEKQFSILFMILDQTQLLEVFGDILILLHQGPNPSSVKTKTDLYYDLQKSIIQTLVQFTSLNNPNVAEMVCNRSPIIMILS